MKRSNSLRSPYSPDQLFGFAKLGRQHLVNCPSGAKSRTTFNASTEQPPQLAEAEEIASDHGSLAMSEASKMPASKILREFTASKHASVVLRPSKLIRFQSNLIAKILFETFLFRYCDKSICRFVVAGLVKQRAYWCDPSSRDLMFLTCSGLSRRISSRPQQGYKRLVHQRCMFGR